MQIGIAIIRRYNTSNQNELKGYRVAGNTSGGMTSHDAALKLFQYIADAEGKNFAAGYQATPTRAWILSTYSQCRLAVENGWSVDDIFAEKPLRE